MFGAGQRGACGAGHGDRSLPRTPTGSTLDSAAHRTQHRRSGQTRPRVQTYSARLLSTRSDRQCCTALPAECDSRRAPHHGLRCSRMGRPAVLSANVARPLRSPVESTVFARMPGPMAVDFRVVVGERKPRALSRQRRSSSDPGAAVTTTVLLAKRQRSCLDRGERSAGIWLESDFRELAKRNCRRIGCAASPVAMTTGESTIRIRTCSDSPPYRPPAVAVSSGACRSQSGSS